MNFKASYTVTTAHVRQRDLLEELIARGRAEATERGIGPASQLALKPDITLSPMPRLDDEDENETWIQVDLVWTRVELE